MCYHTDMDYELGLGSHPSKPVQTSANGFGEWLSVSEAVVFCEQNGLSRTPKTVRKWALRSHQDPDNSDLTARREDVDNGFRWVIERTSLLRKVEQELEFEARRTIPDDNYPASAGSDTSNQVRTGAAKEIAHIDGTTLEEPVRTGLNPSAQVHPSSSPETFGKTDENLAAPVHTGSAPSKPGRSDAAIVEQLQARIEDLKSEVEFYRDELKDRRHTTLALTDVIEAFRLTAATNASKAQERSERRSHDIRPNSAGDSWPSENAADAV